MRFWEGVTWLVERVGMAILGLQVVVTEIALISQGYVCVVPEVGDDTRNGVTH